VIQRHCTSLRYHTLFVCNFSQWPIVSLGKKERSNRS
jgi:hypothetical protein